MYHKCYGAYDQYDPNNFDPPDQSQRHGVGGIMGSDRGEYDLDVFSDRYNLPEKYYIIRDDHCTNQAGRSQ
jgi:hypothetical protein